MYNIPLDHILLKDTCVQKSEVVPLNFMVLLSFCFYFSTFVNVINLQTRSGFYSTVNTD